MVCAHKLKGWITTTPTCGSSPVALISKIHVVVIIVLPTGRGHISPDQKGVNNEISRVDKGVVVVVVVLAGLRRSPSN